MAAKPSNISVDNRNKAINRRFVVFVKQIAYNKFSKGALRLDKLSAFCLSVVVIFCFWMFKPLTVASAPKINRFSLCVRMKYECVFCVERKKIHLKNTGFRVTVTKWKLAGFKRKLNWKKEMRFNHRREKKIQVVFDVISLRWHMSVIFVSIEPHSIYTLFKITHKNAIHFTVIVIIILALNYFGWFFFSALVAFYLICVSCAFFPCLSTVYC